MEHYYSIPKEEVLRKLNTTIKGLSSREADSRLAKYGKNEIQKKKQQSLAALFLSQFKNFLIILLLVATALSIMLGEIPDAIAMLAIVLLSAALGFYQEYKAEKAIEALKGISAPVAKVLRNGKEAKVKAAELVPGDIVLLEAGDIVPADSRIIDEQSLQVDEAPLTGESVPSAKFVEPLKKGIAVADQENMAFMGTIVTYGRGTVVVTSTGMSTELGTIATSLQETKETKTPLQAKFERMAIQIGVAIVALVAIVFVSALSRTTFSIGHLFIFALSLVVAAVPSSLPAIVTIGLSIGTKTLAKRNMIIKKLPAAESLGAVTTICSDKTGTLTKNQMTVTSLFVDGITVNVTGTGYEPKGEFMSDGKPVRMIRMGTLMKIASICNNAQLVNNKGAFEIMGDPTEGALVVLAKKASLDEQIVRKKLAFVAELPFDSDRKMMSVLYKERAIGKIVAYSKGAPDLLLSKCDKIQQNGKVRKLTGKDRIRIRKTYTQFAKNALRVLGFAYKPMQGEQKKYAVEKVEKNMVFVGLAGMIDPPRNEVKEAVMACRKAGINVIVITGDHAVTTTAIAQQIGIMQKGDVVLTGEELDKMSDAKLNRILDKVRIIARALPIQKLRIVNLLQKKGHIVAMTGDGVNDAPALKKADIGIAMGITGTDVAKEVAEATLADDNFATIVNGISEGRNIYDKIIKSTRYLLSCNAGEIATVFLAILLKLPLPLVPLQILLMNLLTDGLPALGLGAEPSDDNVMKRRPRDPKENPLSGQLLMMIAAFGIIMGAGTLFLFSIYQSAGLEYARTVAFTTLVMFQMFAALGSRSLLPFHRSNPLTSKWLMIGIASSIVIHLVVIYWSPLQGVFETVPLTLIDWAKILGVSSFGYLTMELSKIFMRKMENSTKATKNVKLNKRFRLTVSP